MTTTDPAATRPLFPYVTDQRIARIRRALRTAEIQQDMLREMLDDQIAVRRTVTFDGRHVCPVCGSVVGTILPRVTMLESHPGHSHRHGGGQCRGTGLDVSIRTIGGGL